VRWRGYGGCAQNLTGRISWLQSRHGVIGCIEQAEEAFEAMLETTKDVSSRNYNVMLSVHAENKLMAKGKEFVETMSSDGCPNSPVTGDVLIKIYVNSGTSQ